MAQNAPKKPFIAPNSRKVYQSLLRTGMSTKSGDELNLRNCTVANQRLCMMSTCGTSEHLHNRGIDHVQTYCNCGTCTVFLGDCRCTTTGCERRDLDRLLTACTRESAGLAQEGHRTPCQWTPTGESQWSAARDPGKRPLRHDSVVDDLDMHNNGHVNNQSNNAQFDTVRTSLSSITARTTTLPMN